MAAKAESTSKKQTTPEEDAILQASILELREAGQTWGEVAASLKIGQGKAILIGMKANQDPKLRMKWKTEEELTDLIVKARLEDQISWGQIMVRAGISQSKARSLFEKGSGIDPDGHRIGKGGRFKGGKAPSKRGGAERETMVVNSAKAKSDRAKKEAAAKAAVKQDSELFSMTPTALKEHLTGKTIKFRSDGKPRTAVVAEIKVVGKGPDAEVSLTSAKGGQATIPLKAITSVS